MSYDKQTWNKYDDLKTEEENIENGAVVTDNRMNHIEEGIYSHTIDISNPHKVTAAQVGLDKVDNVKQASKVEFDSHTSDISNPHKVTATQIGLDKVDNIQQAAKTDFDSHVNNKSNPHVVTASQVGAYSKTEADTKFATGQSLIDLSTTVKGKADDSAVVHKTGDEIIGGKKTFTEEIKQKNDVDWTYIPDSSNRAEYMRRGGIVTIRWDFTSTGNFDISLGSLPTDFAPRKRIFKSIPEASVTNSMHTLQINAFTGGSPGAITLFKATTGAVFSGQESFVVI